MSETTIQITVSGDNAAETLERITEQLPEDAAIVSGNEAGPSNEDLFFEAANASSALPQQITNWFDGFAANSGMGVFTALIISAAILVAAWVIERFVSAMVGGKGVSAAVDPSDGLARTGAAMRFAFRMVLRLIGFLILVRIGYSIAFAQGSEAMELGLALLGTTMLVRAWYTIIGTLTAPGAPERRATGLSDSEASQVSRALSLMLVVVAIVSISLEFVISVVDAGESGAMFAIVARLISGLALSVFFFAIRKPVGKLIILGFASDRDAPGLVVRSFAAFWPVVYIILQVLQILVEARGYLSGTLGEEANSMKRSFGAFVLLPFVVAGLREWGEHLRRKSSDANAGRILGLFSFLEGAVIVSAGIFILYAWNIDPFATDLTGAKRILPGLVSAAIITVIGVSLWRTASAFLSPKVKGGDEDGDELPDGEGGVGGSRIDTVLPVLRAVLAALIGTVTVLLALSSLGVEIAPLMAGAGILGLAIGFGAQKVVEDVISGVLYLVEDAFRKGEYIETAQGKGIVESIMLRSVRLRHHLGPVFTIPFSAMGTIQNHSRDWVTVKLKFEVAPDQDLEKVRKLIKKVGVQLLEDPELEGQFLAPLKSQGAVALVGSNYQIGVKFTSEPGKQFLIRRKALNAIQKAFKENDIEMAAPRVIVDSPEQATAAAAKALNDAQANAATT